MAYICDIHGCLWGADIGQIPQGNYSLSFSFNVPEQPSTARVAFSLNHARIKNRSDCNSQEGECYNLSKQPTLSSLFIADNPEPTLTVEERDTLIEKYAPTLYFDNGQICNPNDQEQYTE
ncbi:MAG: hypothetical protein GDA44_03830 [Prochloron sp. SP5CPC1]|nr:hypothetical protein [Candidatus Paraprochloron terpiosi SP5CPC1]